MMSYIADWKILSHQFNSRDAEGGSQPSPKDFPYYPTPPLKKSAKRGSTKFSVASPW